VSHVRITVSQCESLTPPAGETTHTPVGVIKRQSVEEGGQSAAAEANTSAGSEIHSYGLP